MKKEKKTWKESGVSETVGFILIFGIMLTGIALVTLYGYPALLDTQQNANVRNMERNMISLQSDVNSLTYKAVPYKETTMQVSGGVLSVKRPDPASSFIDISNSSGLIVSNFSPGSVHFLSESGDIRIALENGAVVKMQHGGSVMLSEPRWFYDEREKILVITLIQVNSSAYLAKSGISTVQMSIEPYKIFAGNNSHDESYPIPTTINFNYTPGEFTGAWKNYMEKVENVNRTIIKAWKINIINI